WLVALEALQVAWVNGSLLICRLAAPTLVAAAKLITPTSTDTLASNPRRDFRTLDMNTSNTRNATRGHGPATPRSALRQARVAILAQALREVHQCGPTEAGGTDQSLVRIASPT